MKHVSLKYLAAVLTAILLLSVPGVPAAAEGSGAGSSDSGRPTISATEKSPYAAYTTRRRRRVVRRKRRVVRRRRRVVRRKRRVVRRNRRVVRRRRRVVRRKRRVVRKPAVIAVAPVPVTSVAPLAVAATSTPAPAPVIDEQASAQAVLDGLKATYPRFLGSTTVLFGDASGYQAVCYFTAARIVISPTHTVGLERILGHEVWHVIDWQDNGRIDWGEAVPPADAATYAN
jgi:hypothetical protein